MWTRRLAAGTTILLLAVLGILWARQTGRTLAHDQLTSAAEVSSEVAAWNSSQGDESINVAVGVFVQSLRFVSASDVHLTGYLWQRWPDELDSSLEPGLVLPELVDSSVELREEYRIAEDRNGTATTLIGWYFEGTIRQPFEYDDYPFDDKVVWLRIWPRNFAANVVLVPDLDAYPGTAVTDVFGIDENIVLGDWERADTYFDYDLSDYNTNFGISEYVGEEGFPELRFNVVLRRKFENAFVVNLVPLAVVALLAFGAVMTATRNDDRANRFGFNFSGVLSTVSALFFVVLLSHIQLRREFSGAGVTYLEYFYFVMYAALVAVSVHAFAVSTTQSDHRAEQMGAVMRQAYWPALLGALVVVTLLAF